MTAAMGKLRFTKDGQIEGVFAVAEDGSETQLRPVTRIDIKPITCDEQYLRCTLEIDFGYALESKDANGSAVREALAKLEGIEIIDKHGLVERALQISKADHELAQHLVSCFLRNKDSINSTIGDLHVNNDKLEDLIRASIVERWREEEAKQPEYHD